MSDKRIQAFVVVHPFGSYVKGEIISDARSIAAIVEQQQSKFVVAAQLPSTSADATTTLNNG